MDEDIYNNKNNSVFILKTCDENQILKNININLLKYRTRSAYVENSKINFKYI